MEFYHVLNRGVDKRAIVLDDKDRLRFMQGLYLYNNKNLLDRNIRRFSTERSFSNNRAPLVSIHAYCLMDNHYHLLLSPVDGDTENLSNFMRKLNMGYAKYFNERYQRTGSLWQGKYKKIHLDNDTHFGYIPYYIHLNPLDKKFPEWRDGTITDTTKSIEWLLKYRWSSLQDYTGIKNYPSILHRNFLTKILGGRETQLTKIKSIITDSFLVSSAERLE